jgi:biopolymer transport protein TolR
MGAATAPSSQKQPEPEINITPLVDVVLVLLIIFMVIAPNMEQGLPVSLPNVQSADAAPEEDEKAVVVSVSADGQVFVEKEKVELDQLGAKVEALRAKEKTPPKVSLKGDSVVTYDKVREVFAALQNQGITGVALVVEEDQPGTQSKTGG